MEGQESDDMMAADRVMAVDEGKEAFQDMVAAVNNADERVKALNEDLDKAISNAVSRNHSNNISTYLVKSSFRKVLQ